MAEDKANKQAGNAHRLFAAKPTPTSGLKITDIVDVINRVGILNEKPAKVAANSQNTKTDVVFATKVLNELLERVKPIAAHKSVVSMKDELKAQKAGSDEAPTLKTSGPTLF
jgi:hypothetical protein